MRVGSAEHQSPCRLSRVDGRPASGQAAAPPHAAFGLPALRVPLVHARAPVRPPFPPPAGVMGVLDSCRARGLRHRGGGRAQRSGGAAAGDGCCHVLHPPEFPFVFGVLGRARPHRRADLIRCRASHLALGVEHHRPGGVVVTTLADRGVGRLMASDGGARRPSRSRWALVRRRTRPPMAPAAAVTGVALAQVSLHPRQFRVTTPALPEPIRGRTHRGGEAGPAGIVRFPGCQIKPSSWGPTQVAAR